MILIDVALFFVFFFFFNVTPTTKIYPLSLHDALPICDLAKLYEDQLHDTARAEAVYKQVIELDPDDAVLALPAARSLERSEEHTSELQSLTNLVCRLLLEKKKKKEERMTTRPHYKSPE